MLYCKIDRATSGVLERKIFDNPERALNKSQVWLPLNDSGAPAWDAASQTCARTENIPDLSNLAVDVDPAAEISVVYDVVTLSAAEIDAKVNAEADQGIDGQKVLKAVVIWIAGKVGVTPAQARDEIKAIYRNL